MVQMVLRMGDNFSVDTGFYKIVFTNAIRYGDVCGCIWNKQGDCVVVNFIVDNNFIFSQNPIRIFRQIPGHKKFVW